MRLHAKIDCCGVWTHVLEFLHLDCVQEDVVQVDRQLRDLHTHMREGERDVCNQHTQLRIS